MSQQSVDDAERDVITPDDGITFEVDEVLDDGNTVGCGSADPGGETVRYEEARSTFSITVEKWGHSSEYVVGDEDSHIFISSDGGDLSVGYGPEFAPIETCIKVWQYETARSQLAKGGTRRFGVMFDDSGLAVFTGDEADVIVAPIQWTWDRPSSPCAPRAPGGPTI